MPGSMSISDTPEKGRSTMKIPPKIKPSFHYQPTGPPDPMTVSSMADRWGLGSASNEEVRTRSQKKELEGKSPKEGESKIPWKPPGPLTQTVSGEGRRKVSAMTRTKSSDVGEGLDQSEKDGDRPESLDRSEKDGGRQSESLDQPGEPGGDRQDASSEPSEESGDDRSEEEIPDQPQSKMMDPPEGIKSLEIGLKPNTSESSIENILGENETSEEETEEQNSKDKGKGVERKENNRPDQSPKKENDGENDIKEENPVVRLSVITTRGDREGDGDRIGKSTRDDHDDAIKEMKKINAQSRTETTPIRQMSEV